MPDWVLDSFISSLIFMVILLSKLLLLSKVWGNWGSKSLSDLCQDHKASNLESHDLSPVRFGSCTVLCYAKKEELDTDSGLNSTEIYSICMIQKAG